MKYRAEIDGLRALAVLPVILFHAGFEWFSGGFVGVDVFFVISGYLITTIIISEMAEGKFSIVNFYERRARRILPALFFVMAACLPFAWLWLTPTDLKDFGQSLVAVSTFSSNILFWLESGYFDTAAELKPLLHTWSLAVEEQYYILFPIFLMLTWRLGIKWVLVFLSVVFLLSLGIAQWSAYKSPSTAFFLLPTRGWELLIGVFAAFYLKYNPHLKSHTLNQALSLFGFGMIVYSIIAFDETTPFPSLYALIPTIGTGLLILCAVPKTYVHKLLSLRFIVGIGLISYSAYLWHQPLLAFTRHRLLGEVSELILIALCLISLVFAWFSWKFVEAPFRNKKTFTRNKIFFFSMACIIIFSSLGLSMHLKNGYGDRVNFTEELANSFERPSLENCFNTPFNHSAEQWGCILGRGEGEINFILFGDSHSLSLKTLIDEKAKQKGIKVFYTGSSGCLPFLGIHPERNDQYENNCNLLNKRVFELAKSADVDGIILSARWSYYTYGDYDFSGAQLISDMPQGPFNLQHSIDTFTGGLGVTIDNFNSIGVPIHLITQHPHQKYPPQSAYFSSVKGFGSIESFSVKRVDFDRLNEIPINAFYEYENNINIYNITDLFCNEFVCLIGDKDRSFYYDDDHLSINGAMKLEEIIEEILLKKAL
ncbi:acyltransferase [Gammaproteobacteria bacterium]|nr:acyltransferase [Gammaproteobacteria bacterium]